ncbi:MAG: 50S ribosomal protein L21, partial [Candidatus Gracilibacteria bacterium]
AIVGIGGKQFRVAEGDTITTEKVGEEGKTVKLNHVFLISDGKESKIGTPLVEGASVEAKVVSIKKAAKVRVSKMKPRARSRSEHGHRQWETTLAILKING